MTRFAMAGVVATLGVVYLAAVSWADGLVVGLIGLLLPVMAAAGAKMAGAGDSSPPLRSGSE